MMMLFPRYSITPIMLELRNKREALTGNEDDLSSPTGNGTASTDSPAETITQTLEVNHTVTEPFMESIFSTSHSEDLLYSLEEEIEDTTSLYVTDASSPTRPVWLYALLAVSLTATLLLCVALVVVLMRLKSRGDDPCDQRCLATEISAPIHDAMVEMDRRSTSSDVKNGSHGSQPLSITHLRAQMPLPRTNMPEPQCDELYDDMSDDEISPLVPDRSPSVVMDETDSYEVMLTDHVQDDSDTYDDARSRNITEEAVPLAAGEQSVDREEATEVYEVPGVIDGLASQVAKEPVGLGTADNLSHVSSTSLSRHTQHLSASHHQPANEEVDEVHYNRSLDMPDNPNVPVAAIRNYDYYLPNVLTMDDRRRPLPPRGFATVMSSDVTPALNTDLNEQDRTEDYISRLEITEEGGRFIDRTPQVTITIDIPAGTVRSLTCVDIVQSYNPLFMPRVDDNGKILSPSIHFCPHQLRLEKTLTVTLRLPQMNPSNSYHVLYSPTDIGEECEWIDLTQPGHSVAGISPRVNANAKEVVLSLFHFCVFIIIEKATGERTEAKFCQLQASLLLHPTNDMVQVDVKVCPDDTDDVMTGFDVRQHLCVRNNEKALELTVETSLFEPPEGYSIVQVPPYNMVLPFRSVWRDKSPSTTFHFQLKVSSRIKQEVFLVCRLRAQQQECDEDAVTLVLSRPLKLIAHQPQRSVHEKANIYSPQCNKHEQEEIQDRPSRRHSDARPREDPNKTYVKRRVGAEAAQTNDVITMDLSGSSRIVYHATNHRDNSHIHSASPQLQLRGPSIENQSANPGEGGGGDLARFEQMHQSTAGGGAFAESSPYLEHTHGEILSRVHVPQQTGSPSNADSNVPPAQNGLPRTFITETDFATSDNAELNMRLMKLFENARTSHFVAY